MPRKRGAAATVRSRNDVVQARRRSARGTARARGRRRARSRAGSQSRRRQISAHRVGVRLDARERRQRRAGPIDEQLHRVSALASGGTSHAVSLATPSASRLVARTVSRGQARSSASTISAHASTRCSQLSSTMQRALVADRVDQRLEWRRRVALGHLQRCRDVLREQLRRRERRQIHPDDARE